MIKSNKAASSSSYAFVLGAIALGAIGGLVASGDSITELFGRNDAGVQKGINDAPVITSGSIILQEDTSFSGTLTAEDADGDVVVFLLAAAPRHGSVTLAPNGNFTYTPDANFFGEDLFVYRASDNRAGGKSESASLSITVQPVNDAPVGEFEIVATAEQSRYTSPVRVNDPDGDILSFRVTTNAAHGGLAVQPSADSASLAYDPDSSYTGMDEFSIEGKDGSGLFDNHDIEIAVSPAIALNQGAIMIPGSPEAGISKNLTVKRLVSLSLETPVSGGAIRTWNVDSTIVQHNTASDEWIINAVAGSPVLDGFTLTDDETLIMEKTQTGLEWVIGSSSALLQFVPSEDNLYLNGVIQSDDDFIFDGSVYEFQKNNNAIVVWN